MRKILLSMILFCGIASANHVNFQVLNHGSFTQPEIVKFVDGTVTCYLSEPTILRAHISCVNNTQGEVK